MWSCVLWITWTKWSTMLVAKIAYLRGKKEQVLQPGSVSWLLISLKPPQLLLFHMQQKLRWFGSFLSYISRLLQMSILGLAPSSDWLDASVALEHGSSVVPKPPRWPPCVLKLIFKQSYAEMHSDPVPAVWLKDSVGCCHGAGTSVPSQHLQKHTHGWH